MRRLCGGTRSSGRCFLRSRRHARNSYIRVPLERATKPSFNTEGVGGATVRNLEDLGINHLKIHLTAKLTCKEGGPSFAPQSAGPYDAVRCSAMLYRRFIDCIVSLSYQQTSLGANEGQTTLAEPHLMKLSLWGVAARPYEVMISHLGLAGMRPQR